MDHKGGEMRDLAGKANISPRYGFCKYGKNHDSILTRRNERVPEHLSSPKKVSTAQARQKGEGCRLKTAIQTEDNVSCNSGVKNMTHLQHSDASSELIECMSEESVNMKPRTQSPFLKTITTSEKNSSFLKDGSLEDCPVLVPEKAPSIFGKNIISIADMLWDWSDGSSDGSVIMDLESPQATLESMASIQISHDHKLEGSEFEVTPKKIISSSSGELVNQAKESSNRCRSMKQETIHKSMTSAMASTSNDATGMKPKEQKQVIGLKEDEKRKKELPMLVSSLPVKTSLLGRVKANKKVDAVVEPGITNEKSPTLDKTVKSVKPKKVGVTPVKGPRTSLSPIVVNKKTPSPSKRIHLSPKPALLLKTRSLVVKYRLPMPASGRIIGQSRQESSKIVRNAGISKLGEEKVSKQFAASQAPKSTANYAPVLNSRKLRSVKNQVEAGKVNGVKEKTVHVVEQKLVGLALNFAEQKHTKLRSQQSSRTLPSQSSISSSAFVSSSSEEENYGSQLTISDSSGSKKNQIGEGKGGTPLHVVEQKLLDVGLNSAEQKHINLRPQQSPRTLSSRSSISSSAFVSSSYEEKNDGSQMTISAVGGSKKTQIGEGKGRAKCGSKKTQIGEGKGRTSLCSQKSEQKRTTNVSLEDKSLSPDKMSFRRGKEVSPQRESPDQGRLGFMQAKAVSEDENFEGEIGMSGFRKSRESTTASSATPSPGSPTVVLGHQDVQKMNNTQALFNDVIEETANKLVETRKSKVKALVSAFESILSLQERTAQ